ncbi:MAG: cyclic nucleotide-binding domain-containing protein [Gammaproteobacteria bacterium]|nr:cyclic nucleotide-binding domain-containing protein [Gammaproteobacteria bacterium]MDH5802320.1 cyclic nucleotide-binding domain-containing protein [Gammaproteobacteria bacterium]
MSHHIDLELNRQLSAIKRKKHFGELLTPEDRKFLIDHGLVYQAKSGTILCQQDKVGDDLFIILHGEVEVSENAGEIRKVLGKLSTGELFGEISALFAVPRIATVSAHKPSVILEVARDDFVELLDHTPNLKDLVYERLYERSLETALRTWPSNNIALSQIPMDDLSMLLSCWKPENIN